MFGKYALPIRLEVGGNSQVCLPVWLGPGGAACINGIGSVIGWSWRGRPKIGPGPIRSDVKVSNREFPVPKRVSWRRFFHIAWCERVLRRARKAQLPASLYIFILHGVSGYRVERDVRSA